MKVLMCFVVQQEVEAEGAVALEEAGNSRLRRPVRILDLVAVPAERTRQNWGVNVRLPQPSP